MRALARRGVRACCIDMDPGLPGFHSVYGPGYRCPNPDDEPREWVAFMIGLARKLGAKPVLIPSADQFVSAMARHASGLEESFLFCHSAIQVQASLATKQRQYELAAAHGFPIPRTQWVRSEEEAAVFGAEAQYPCLMKPAHFRQWERVPRGHALWGKKLMVANSPRELLDQYRFCAQVTPEMVVQEIIQGPETAKLVYLSCYARDGRRLGGCLVRELRTTPMRFGSASIVEPVADSETDGLCDRFLRSIGYAGICEIEMKRDSRNGRVKMIETNPRYSVTSDAAPYAGVELGWLHYLDLTGEPVAPAAPKGRPFRHVHLVRDFLAIRECRRGKLLRWMDLIGAYRPPLAFFDFDLRDWRASAGTLMDLARIVLGPSLRRVFPKRSRAT